MNDILHSIVVAAQAMSWVEILATFTFAGSVILCNFRRWENYPLGIIGTIAFFFVFWHAGLYSVALLQIWLTAVQLYGLWFWLKGDKGGAPKITRTKVTWWASAAGFTILTTALLAAITTHFGSSMAIPDALLFSLSVVAQFFLDRKKLENWVVWFVINTISIPLFWSQGLYLTAIIYTFFWFNAIVAFRMWYKEYTSYDAADIAVLNDLAKDAAQVLAGHQYTVIHDRVDPKKFNVRAPEGFHVLATPLSQIECQKIADASNAELAKKVLPA